MIIIIITIIPIIAIIIITVVDLQAMFDKRVKKLFEEEVRCPGELDQIKKNYM